MNKKQITILKGDYTGPEIMKAGLSILKAVTDNQNFYYNLNFAPFGGEAIDKFKDPLPESTLNSCKNSDAILLSAIGGPKWNQANKRPEEGLLRIRKELNLFSNIRPTSITKSMASYSPIKNINNIDFIIVRELTSGIYFGKPRIMNNSYALDTMRYTVNEIKRVSHIAFQMAEKRHHHVTLVDKSNVLATSKLWHKIVANIAKQYPDVNYDTTYVDAASMKIINDPKHFDVILTENLFGDILSDEAAQITGSLGTIPSMSKGDNNLALYEPIHGSAPDIAGKNIANPFSMINSVKMMLTHSFNRKDLANHIEKAVDETVQANIVTPDLGGNHSTDEVTAQIIKNIRKQV